MIITPIRTRVLKPPQTDLWPVLENLHLVEKNILVVTSKIVSLHQGRCVKIDTKNHTEQKLGLIMQEADEFLSRQTTKNLKISLLTKKYGLVVGSAGIDESNGDGYFILWPDNPAKFVKELYDWLQNKYGLSDFGVIIVDTIKRPFRRGAVGFAVAHYGFKALYSYRQQKDLFGRQFKSEQVNLTDAIAAAAVLVMGEGNEQTPLALVEDIPQVEFFAGSDEVAVAGRDDYFSGLVDESKWKKINY